MIAWPFALMLSAASLSGPDQPPLSFDLSDVGRRQSAAAADEARRFLIGDAEAPPADRPGMQLRLRGAKVKLKVPIG